MTTATVTKARKVKEIVITFSTRTRGFEETMHKASKAQE